MTLRVAVIGTGPAGFAVAAALLTDGADIAIDLIDRAERPDGLLRHGPAAGVQRVKDVARRVDAILRDDRVSYFGGVEVGAALTLSDLRGAAHAVVLATGAPGDMPLSVAGKDSVGVGTVSHLQAWLAGNADVDAEELDFAVDSAVLFGVSAENLTVARALCRKLRHVQIVDPRPLSDIEIPPHLPENLVLRGGLVAVGVVGRNRARAVRCTHRPDRYGRVITEDLRAQLLLRPRSTESPWRELDELDGHVAHDRARVLSGGAVGSGLYVAGWAGRDPSAAGSHDEDAAAVADAIRTDCAELAVPGTSLADVLAAKGISITELGDWSAVDATDALLDRFAGEGTSPLADYDALMEQVDED
jgi:hypothetical protein